jgi:hypothetical protein
MPWRRAARASHLCPNAPCATFPSALRRPLASSPTRFISLLLWLPAPPPTPTNTSSGCPTSDDFNRANSTNLGANWTERAGNLEIYGNLLRNVSTATDNIATLCGTYSNVLVSSQVKSPAAPAQ